MKTIDEDIRTNRLRPCYLLYGQEGYLKKQYRDKLKTAAVSAGDTMNFSAFEGKGIRPGELIDLAETLPFFADRRVILVEESGFFKNSCEELAAYLPGAAPSVCFIFVEEEIDKRSKMYKAVTKAGRAVEFASQSGELLTRWVLSRLKKEGRNITASVMQMFLARTGTDMGTIDRELEKLVCYTMGRQVIGAADVEAVVTEQTENRIFEMISAAAGHNQRKELELYYDLLMLKEPPMRILYLILRQFQTLLYLKDMSGKGFDRKAMAQQTGIPAFAVERNVAQAKGFTAARLKEALREGAGLEEAVKTGRLDDRMAVELFLVKYSV